MTVSQNPVKWKVFGDDDAPGILMVDGSRVYDIPPSLSVGLEEGDEAAYSQIEELLTTHAPIDLRVPNPPDPQSLSLNVSSSCNLSCAYCYAGRGGFGGAQTLHMKWPVAQAAVDKLFENADQTAPVTVGFIGGEPFVNSRLIHRLTEYAAQQGAQRGLDVRFSVTTNGTLLKHKDLDLLRRHPFAVTFSLDGGSERHERQRPGAAFDEIAQNARLLLTNPGLAKISARATVNRGDFDLIERFDQIREIGFTDIGFSPVRVGIVGQKLEPEDWRPYLSAMIDLARRELETLKSTGSTAFSNFMIALKKIHAGACSPYPCGAGGGYFSVAADGTWYACHRAVGDKRFQMGDNTSLDTRRRQTFLNDRHVAAQTDCKTCWARYLCSGSCHQEVEARRPESCDFIRGWLEFCLTAYLQVSNTNRFEEVISE